jgi:hypothetical protein
MTGRDYVLQVDGARGVVIATLRGLWTPEVVQAYGVALDTALTELARAGTPRGRALVLVDRRELQVMPRDVVDASVEMVSRVLRVRKVAVVVPNVLSKFQSDRILPSSRRFFGLDEAMAWLLEAVNA